MGRKVKIHIGPTFYAENRVPLKETTKFFEGEKYREAVEYANHKRSYIGLAYDEDRELAGFYIPS